MAVKPEMLAAPLQPSAAARAPAGLNRRCPRSKPTARPQTGSLGRVGAHVSCRHPGVLPSHSWCQGCAGDPGLPPKEP